MYLKRFIPYSFIYLYASLLWALLLFTFFRILLFALHVDLLNGVENMNNMLAQSMIMGLRFDISTSCYVLLLPLLLYIVAHFTGVERVRNVLLRIGHVWITLFFILALCLMVIDIPFFNQFYLRLNSVAFMWLKSSPQVVCGMMVGESTYWKYIALFLTVATMYALVQRALYRKFVLSRRNFHVSLLSIPLVVLTLFLLFCGVRGGISCRPINVKLASISNSIFINQVSLNPVFSLMRSTSELISQQNNMSLTDSKAALEFAREELGRDSEFKRVVAPTNTEAAKSMNVVVVMLESIADFYLKESPTLVPFLAELKGKSMYFSSMYAAGVHTHNAIHATLFSYPGYMHHHTMEVESAAQLDGMISQFNDRGYKSMLHITHNKNFDNIFRFTLLNNVNRLICDEDYPEKEIKTSFGVPDHVMFDRALEEIGQNHKAGIPSLSFLLTTSNHAPYYIPTNMGFEPKSQSIVQQVVEYTDWALERFMEQASKQEWFENTIFVIEGDHGLSTKTKYPISLTYNHIPLMIYSPGLIEPAVVDDFMLQMDILPTVCGLLGYGYTNRSFGVDVMHEKRPYAYFSADWAVGAVSDRWLFVHRDGDADYLFDLVADDGCNLIEQFPAVADSMSCYSISMTQAAYDCQYKLALGLH